MPGGQAWDWPAPVGRVRRRLGVGVRYGAMETSVVSFLLTVTVFSASVAPSLATFTAWSPVGTGAYSKTAPVMTPTLRPSTQTSAPR